MSSSKLCDIIQIYPQVLVNAKVSGNKKYDYDKDDEIKLRNVDQISLESNSTMPERGDSVTLYAKRLPNTPEYILRIAKPEDYLFTK